MTLLLSDDDVRAATDMPVLVEQLELMFRKEAEQGDMLLPPRTNLSHAKGFLRVMPVVMPAAGVLGLKMFHGSLERGVRYVVVVCDIESGEVRAVLDAAYLTAARTGATSGVATRHLARADASTVGVIGSGLEAETNLLGVCAVREITAVKVYSRSPERRASFAERMAERLSVPVVAVSSPEEAVAATDIVVVATNTGTGGGVAFQGDWLEPGQHVVSIGSTAPQLREIDTATFDRSDLVVVDAEFSQMEEESGDVMALRSERRSWDRAVNLVDVLTGAAAGRIDRGEITLFKSVGTAAQDLAAASCVAASALRHGFGTDVAEIAEAKLF